MIGLIMIGLIGLVLISLILIILHQDTNTVAKKPEPEIISQPCRSDKLIEIYKMLSKL